MTSSAPNGGWSSRAPRPDVLGAGFEAVTLELEPDDEGPVVATLVRSLAAGPESAAGPSSSDAVLYVHGYNDYFFHPHLARYWNSRGAYFYALDLRKSGRSLRDGQTPYFMRDVADYFPELDAALAVMAAEGHRRVVINAHSTGGLVTALWLQDGPPHAELVVAAVLNSPFIALDPGNAARGAAAAVAEKMSARKPYAVLPTGVSDLYVRSIHKDYAGEWDFDLTWKRMTGTPIKAGWLAGIRRAQRAVQAGLSLPVPVLVLCSTLSVRPAEWTEDLHRADAVLNVEQIARWATALGPQVTCVRIVDGMHDLVLSQRPAREETFAQMTRWLGAYAADADFASDEFLVSDNENG